MGRRHRNPTSKGCWRDHPYLHGHHLVQNVLRLHWTDPTARTAPRWCPGPMRAEGKDGLMTLWASVELETSARNGSWTVEPSSERKLTMHRVQNTLSKAADLHLCATCVVLSCNQPGMTLWVRPRLHQLLQSWQTKGHKVSRVRVLDSPVVSLRYIASPFDFHWHRCLFHPWKCIDNRESLTKDELVGWWVVWLVSWLVLLKGSEIMLSIYTSCCMPKDTHYPFICIRNCQKKTHKASKQDCRSTSRRSREDQIVPLGLKRLRFKLTWWYHGIFQIMALYIHVSDYATGSSFLCDASHPTTMRSFACVVPRFIPSDIADMLRPGFP